MIKNDQNRSPQNRIALIGEAMIELSDANFQLGSARIGFAGDTLNTAIYLSRALQGGAWTCDYLTVVGDDRISDEMIRYVSSEGIGTDGIGRSERRTLAAYAINLDERGERSFTYWRSSSAARTLFQTQCPSLQDLAKYNTIYLSAISLAILPAHVRHDLIERCRALKHNGHTIIFDSNYRPTLWESPDEARAAIRNMWSATTIALPSHDDEILLYPNEEPEGTLARIADLGVREIVLKRGARGPLLWADGAVFERDYPVVEPVTDTTAAGDSFNAGYLGARLSGAEIEAAAVAGHAMASKVIRYKGAIMPRG